MAYTVDFTAAAEADLDDIIDWYNQFNTALADDFMAKLNVIVQQLEKNPEQFQKIHKSFRKANIDRFPYKIIYRTERQSIIVIAIAHHKRKAYWKKRK